MEGGPQPHLGLVHINARKLLHVLLNYIDNMKILNYLRPKEKRLYGMDVVLFYGGDSEAGSKPNLGLVNTSKLLHLQLKLF